MEGHRRFAALYHSIKPWFQKRNVIIVSEHQVKHIPLSARMQFGMLMLVAGCICWASYSTGSFLAARTALKERNQTLRSVANARIETSFNAINPASPLTTLHQHAAQADPLLSLNDPMFALSALDDSKLYARIAYLEHKVSELQQTNEQMIQRVRTKTSGRISDLESIIRQTGLNPDDLEKQAQAEAPPKAKNAKAKDESAKSEGGPYIPAEPISIAQYEYDMYDTLDRLSALHQVVNNLPLASPLANGDEQSGFGHRIDPFTGRLALHSGLDLAGPANAKITCPAAGKVIAAGYNGAYGNAVDVDHGFGVVTRYGHLSRILVQKGDVLNKGDVIGIQGSTGRSTGAHLHYEIRYRDKPMNPRKFLAAGRYVPQE